MPCALPGAFCAYRRKGYGGGRPFGFAAFTFPHTRERRNRAIAIYHLSIKIISRGKGKSAAAAAAYRAGEKITNEYDSIIHDYTRKGGVAHTEILLPDHAPREYLDRTTLWNAVERGEKNKNAQLSREIELALPVELTAGQNLSLVREYVNRHFVSAGMCADVCIHDKNDGNPHAHIMLTMRPIEPDGTWGAKCHKINGRKINAVDWNDQSKAEEWRQGLADAVNAALEQQGVAERIDHRSYERQGVELIPTVHLGVADSAMEKCGIHTERGDINRQIQVTNSELRQLRARINHLKKWLAEAEPTEPSLQDVFSEILGGNGKTRWQKTADLKTAAKVLVFLQSNNITELSQLRQKVSDMYGQQQSINEKLKKTDRRLTTLAEHIRQSEIYAKHKAVYRQYKQQAPNSRDAYYESHRAELMLYEAAAKYLTAHLNGRDKIPLGEWKSEQARLTSERDGLYQEYYRLKEEVREVEVIRHNVESAARDDRRIDRRDKGAEL